VTERPPDPTSPGARAVEGPTDPRFLLANERTLLAWLRTALAFVATGIALVALRHVGVHADWPQVAAAVSSVVGIVTAVWAYWHWRTIDRAIREGTVLPPPTIGPLLVLGVVVIAVTAIVAIVARL
jgi:putative membrane protein